MYNCKLCGQDARIYVGAEGWHCFDCARRKLNDEFILEQEKNSVQPLQEVDMPILDSVRLGMKLRF